MAGGLLCHIMLGGGKEVLPKSLLEAFLEELALHEHMFSWCIAWWGAVARGWTRNVWEDAAFGQGQWKDKFSDAETAEEEIHCWKEKRQGSRDEHATSSNLNVHVVQHLTCWALQARWQAWQGTHARLCRAELGSALGAAKPSTLPAHLWCTTLFRASDYQVLQLALACSLHAYIPLPTSLTLCCTERTELL